MIVNISELAFRHLKSLIHLNLSECQVKNVHQSAFSDLSKLEILDLSFNCIEEMNETYFSDLINLKEINLNKNPFIYNYKDILKFYNSLNIKNLSLVID